jgi:hypothetical protein
VKRALRLIVIVALVATVVPWPAFAHGPRGGSSGFRGGHVAGAARSGRGFVHKGFSVQQKSVFPQPVDPWKSWGVSPKHHQGFHHRSFTPFVPGFVGTPSIIVTAPSVPVVVEASPVIEASPVVYVSPSVSAPGAALALPAPAALPTPALVELAEGWYQLRGDGTTTPYRWVWIPKPPASPAPEAAAPPLQGADGPARPAEARAGDSRGQAYQWTDDRGVTTWTNRLERVPKRFRGQ